MHESIYSHVPNTQPVLRGLGIDSDINPDDIRPPIHTPAPDPDDNVEQGCDRGSDVLPLVPKSANPDLESDINPDNIRPPTLVPGPDPDDNLDCSHHNESAPMPTHLQNTVPGFESDINPDDIRPPIIVPAPDPDDGVEGTPFKDTPPRLESDSTPVGDPYPHGTRDPFSPTPHLPPPWERLDGMVGATQIINQSR